MIEVFSYGGGVQSVALCVLVREGALPRPDHIAIADTGREMPTTWEYLEEIVQPYLAPIGLKVERVPHSLARVDLFDAKGLPLLPMYTSTTTGVDLWGEPTFSSGRLPAYYSGEWKRDVMERYWRSLGVKECNQWIGYSTDEAWRVKKDHRPWCHLRFPLLELGVSRAMCYALIEKAGLPRPNKSRCWMCPHQNNQEWAEVRARPDVFEAAVRLERQINEADPDPAGELYFWSGRRPLPLAVFEGNDGVPLPARRCETEGCWT